MHPRAWPAVAVLGIVLAVDLPRLGVGLRSPTRVLLFLIVVAAGLCLTIWGRQRPRAVQRPAGWLLASSFVWILFVSPLGTNPIRGTLVAAALLATVSIGAAVGSELGWSWFGRVLERVLMLLLLAAAAMELNKSGFRWHGWAEEPNGLGTIAALGVIAGASALVQRRWWMLPILPLGAVILVLTEARMPAIAALFGVALALRPLLGRGFPSALMALGVISGVVLLSTESLGQRAAELGQLDDITTLTGRTDAWSFLAEEIALRPFTGFGPESTQDLLTAGSGDSRVSWGPTHGHNAAVQMAVHGGWVPAVLFVAAFGAYGLSSRRQPQSDRDAMVLALFLIGITEHLVREPSLVLLILAAAFTAGPASAARRQASKPDSAISRDLVATDTA